MKKVKAIDQDRIALKSLDKSEKFEKNTGIEGKIAYYSKKIGSKTKNMIKIYSRNS